MEETKLEKARKYFQEMLKEEKAYSFDEICDFALESASLVTDNDDEITEISHKLIGEFLGVEEW